MRLLLTLISALLLGTSSGQTYVHGRVTDALSSQPVESASILSADNMPLAITDQQGYFSVTKHIGAGSIRIVSAGYQAVLINPDGQSELTIALKPAIVNLRDVLVLQTSQASKFQSLAKVDLELKPVKNTQELLRLVPGLFVAQHAGGGKAEQVFLRGFDCDHGTDVAVSVDGMPVNMVSHAHGQGYADAHFIIPETVNKIDFGSGPYYAQYGDANTAGYVNFSTYDNIRNSLVKMEAGNFNTFRVLGMFDLLKADKNKQSAYLATEYNYTDGPTVNPQRFSRFNLFGKYRTAFGDRTLFSVSVSVFSSKWNASGQIPERAVSTGALERFGSVDPSEGGLTARYNANIQLTHRVSPQASLNTRLYFSRYKFDLYSNFSFFLNDTINGDAINQAEERTLCGFNSALTTHNLSGKVSWNSVYGVSMRHDAISGIRLSHVLQRQRLDDIALGDIRETTMAVFSQQQFSTGKWFLDVGFRGDYLYAAYIDGLSPTQSLPQQQFILSPKLNLQYTASRELQVYFKTGKGFHSNDARVIVANKGREVLPAAYGTDLGLILKPNSRMLVNIAAWWLFLNQEFVYVGDDGNIEPSGKTKRLGIETILRYQFTDHLFANLNLNLAKPRALGAAKGQDFIPLAPTFTSTGGLFYKNLVGWSGGLSYRYMKNRPANEDNSVTAKGYFVTDLALSFSRPKYELGLAVENLFNTAWNEAQFATTSRLRTEPAPVTDLNFTPGSPFAARLSFAVFF